MRDILPGVPLALLLFVSLCGCAPSRLDIIQVRPWFAPRPPSEVPVFTSRAETPGEWNTIAIIHGPRLPAGSKIIYKQQRQAHKEAARMGADGVILIIQSASDNGELSERQEPEIFLSGFAIKYAVTTSTSAAR